MHKIHTDSKGIRLPSAPKNWPFGRVKPVVLSLQEAPF